MVLTLSYLLLLGIVIVSTMAMSAFLYHEDETLRDLRVRASGSVTFPAWLLRSRGRADWLRALPNFYPRLV